MAIFETETVAPRDYEITNGWNGSGVPVYFIHWLATETQKWELEGMELPFRSESEAVANAECQTRCGRRTY